MGRHTYEVGTSPTTHPDWRVESRPPVFVTKETPESPLTATEVRPNQSPATPGWVGEDRPNPFAGLIPQP